MGEGCVCRKAGGLAAQQGGIGPCHHDESSRHRRSGWAEGRPGFSRVDTPNSVSVFRHGPWRPLRLGSCCRKGPAVRSIPVPGWTSQVRPPHSKEVRRPRSRPKRTPRPGLASATRRSVADRAATQALLSGTALTFPIPAPRRSEDRRTRAVAARTGDRHIITAADQVTQSYHPADHPFRGSSGRSGNPCRSFSP
jgi:hypothetical protein